RAVELGKIEPARMNALEWAGPMLVLGTNSSFAAAEPPTELAWLLPDLPASYTYEITPRLLLAPLYEAQSDRLTAWALADGREHWSERGLGKFTRIKQLWADDERAYVLSDAGLLALELLDGEVLWQTNTLGSDCGVAVGEGLLVIEDPTGHQIVEAATGKRIAQLPVPSRSPRCAWEGYDDYGVAPGVIADGRLYAFDTEQGEHPQALRAFDLATRAELWHAEGFGDQVLAVDQDAVYIEQGEIDLIALDSGTGKAQARVAIGAPFTMRVEQVGGAAGPLVVVTDEFAGEWILGRTEAAPVPESFVISGRLVPSGMDRKRVAGVRVRVGDRVVKTDKRGRFEVRGQAIGAIVVEPADNPWEYDYGDLDEPPVVIEARRVLLDGQGKYDLGEIEAFEVPLA
ncbi:MAG: PQQ-binding-like beta-propeller repeat protein, partial [Deltaproteobacteria bacterium]|nr:PQQ-binding-like beta-propeller repeat protein [Deltaproteobacteria bacterium]